MHIEKMSYVFRRLRFYTSSLTKFFLMPKKISNKILALILCCNFGCQTPPPIIDPFVLSNLPNVQFLEKQDHGFCSLLKVDFDKSDDLKSGLYWRCRLSLAKSRLSTNINSPETMQNNSDIIDLITKISLKLAQTSESILAHENKKIDNRQHHQCLAMGYEIATEDQAKIDDYFACRKALIDNQQSVLPFNNPDYLKYPNRSYNIGFAIDRRVDEEIKHYNDAKLKYPTCVKFNLYNVNFGNCTKARDNVSQCLNQIDKKKFIKEREEKISCQRQSYARFPDEFLKEEDSRKAEIDRMKANSDFYNQYSLESLGLSSEDFGGENQDQSDNTPKKNINSKEGLYSKFELTTLRKKYALACQKDAESRVDKYVVELTKSCEELAQFEIIGEE
jgi:hypothetical protein